MSKYINGPNEALRIINFDFTKPGSWTKRDGSTLYIGATTAGRISGLYEFERLNGFSQLIVTANTNAYQVNSGNFTSIRTGLKDSALTDFITFVDRLWVANGQEFFKYDGTQATNYALPAGSTVGFVAGITGSGSGFTGTFIYSYGYLNDRGYAGPASGGLTVSVAGASGVVLSGFTLPASYGITSLVFYRSDANLVEQFRIGYAAAGATQFVDNDITSFTDGVPTSIWLTLAPRYLEIHNNQLMMAGFSTALSSVYFSDIGEPESVQPEANFEVRSNDGDRITTLKEFNGELIIAKKNSMHKLSGDNPDTFLLTEISGEYGCLSNRAAAVYETRLLMLDKKGIVEYNGANVAIVSNKVEPTFLSMNITAAEDNAIAIHNRLRNEVWFAIPCNGATMNNCVVVFDYVSQAFAVWDVPPMSSLAMVKQRFSAPWAFFGGYTGAIFNFGSSLFGDNGNAITCLIQTQFHTSTGKSSEQVFRRLWLDNDPVGTTSAINVNVYANYGSSAQVTRTMYQNAFQNRIDFGVSGKSVSFEFSNTTATDPIRINGYSVESRKQRDV